MGWKLKWFRRRITFEGIPSAPERNIRKKEHNTGITVIGVYRQNVTYEDYIEPARSSYWEPPNQPIATTRIRKRPTSTTPSAIANRISEKHFEKDKITTSTKDRHNGGVETPPEPPYSPPKPPARQGLSKAKSTPNMTTLKNDTELTPTVIEASQSIEVLDDVSYEATSSHPLSPAPKTARVNYNGIDSSSDENEEIKSKPLSPLTKKLDAKSSKIVESNKGSPGDNSWKHQQPEFFCEILETVNGLANASKPDERDVHIGRTLEAPNEDDQENITVSSYEIETFNDIFEKVKAKPRPPKQEVMPSQTHLYPNSMGTASLNASTESIEDIFEPRPTEFTELTLDSSQENVNGTPLLDNAADNLIMKKKLQDSVQEIEPNIQNTDANQPQIPIRSILKNRAPAPPQDPPAKSPAVVEIPTPPPRSIRNKEPVTKYPNNSEDDEDDDYSNWNHVARHRSSINHTVAAEVNPDIIKNVPASLQMARPSAISASARVFLEEPPRTLRGMRNRDQSGKFNGLFLNSYAGKPRDSGSEADA